MYDKSTYIRIIHMYCFFYLQLVGYQDLWSKFTGTFATCPLGRSSRGQIIPRSKKKNGKQRVLNRK